MKYIVIAAMMAFSAQAFAQVESKPAPKVVKNTPAKATKAPAKAPAAKAAPAKPPEAKVKPAVAAPTKVKKAPVAVQKKAEAANK